RGGDVGRLEAGGQLHPTPVRVRPAARASSLRPGEGEATPGRGRIRERLRRRRAASASALFLAGGGDRRLSRRRGDPIDDAAHGARGLPWVPGGKGAQRGLRLQW